MLTMKDWPKIKKAYEDVIAEVVTTIRETKEIGEYGDVNEKEGSVHLPFSQVWESFMPKLKYRHVLGEYRSKRYSCPHTEGGEVERVLILFNEGGCNSTGICLDCLMEWVERNRKRIWKGEDE